MYNQINTPADWGQLTPQQRRDYRIDRYLNPADISFVSPAVRRDYQVRARRLVDVYALKEPDRVPLTLHFGSLPLQQYGLDYYSAMSNFKQAIEVYNRFNTEYADELDSFANIGMIIPGQAFELLDYKMYSWPGQGLPRNASNYQFVEGEYMQAGEYDALIDDPSDFWMRYYLPRIFGSLDHLGRLSPLTDLVEIPTAQLMLLGAEPVQALLGRLLEAGKLMQEREHLLRTCSQSGLSSGFPAEIHYLCIAPFDILGDTLRGTRGIMTDMYRRPEQLLEALEVITRIQIKTTLARARAGMGLVVTFPLHKGADGWMSQSQFERFYWPTLKKTIDALIEEGLIVTLFAEGSYDSRLESVNEFPPGAVHWWFDKTDIARAKQVLGSKCSLSGNVPSSLLMKGTPDEVKQYCRRLIEVCGAGGGYILAEGAADVESRLENLQAMAAAAREYGVYRR